MYNYIQDINMSEADILWNKNQKNSIEKKYVLYVPCSSNIYPLVDTPPPMSSSIIFRETCVGHFAR